LLDLRDGYSRAHNLAGRGVGEREDGALEHGPSDLAVQFPQGVLVVLGDAFSTYQAAGGCGDFAAKGLQLARLAWLASLRRVLREQSVYIGQAVCEAGILVFWWDQGPRAC
jgi:hypothetical protein